MRTLVALVLLLAVVPAHAGQYKTITCKGRIGVGSSDSGIYGLDNDCGWLTRSRIASIIYKKCDVLDDCEIVGVAGENNLFVKILSVRRVPTAEEPSVDIIRETACREAMPWMDNCAASIYLISVKIVDLNVSSETGVAAWNYTVNLSYKELSDVTTVYDNVRFSLEYRDGAWRKPQ
ncbi:hypothetical protein [Fundidesulfovibrio magnetotacticus]|uniref:hypothetical protein n=1 Tax=Fundidesulfovibrio magnetotacticus TaxID=2730080 RepID=UPI0015631F1E|nr:hypothetical protein [Fundidesulfovibrio magnetotacticus]